MIYKKHVHLYESFLNFLCARHSSLGFEQKLKRNRKIGEMILVSKQSQTKTSVSKK